ncbi:hypothetical protein SYNPS1DRAFT_25297 [Syncephalis pseudoplumigaleata]|uniref:Extracellular membrane protein CFEM domain-containing protein n=1 Tax=Syncephalis pseudoplumigaleata TaxID=1712513 RepID=A0A4P9YSS4_9FUNG|nr:hypothetical protein SYNPS1DRAFT_25297 [Syncephalis pseudoplumigaleata]|eukprot:RKP22814.1 hypothetical protein SYNPS1DRAFT_25297 [Syncephalis pseudoplumigaleata]
MKSFAIAALAVLAFAAATATADDGVVSCLYMEWKPTCQRECLKIGPNIQFNRCYNYVESDLMCKCNDQDMTQTILGMLKTNNTPPATEPSKPENSPPKEDEPKDTPTSTEPEATPTEENKTGYPATSAETGSSCENGAWDCDGTSGKLCSNGAWITVGCPSSTACKKTDKAIVCALADK